MRAKERLQFARFSLDNAVDTMVCVDRDARFIDVNDSFCRSSGYSREELLSMTVHDIDPDYSAEIWPEFWEKLKQSGSLTFETCHRSKEGRIFPVEITASYLEYNGKEYHCSFARDITERKRAEEALRESQARLKLAVQASNTGLFDWDLRTNEVYFSPEWKKQIGYEIDEISNDFSEWQNRVHPDDLDRMLETIKSYIENPWPNYEVEFRFRHKDGSYRGILTRASLMMDTEGKPYRMLGSHLDITERKQAEQALRQQNEVQQTILDNMG
jgi:PAS domain S-box-containing protein